jgi:hypothetical protein
LPKPRRSARGCQHGNPPAIKARARRARPTAAHRADQQGLAHHREGTPRDWLVSGECKQITQAAEKVGLARESLGRALDKPHVAEFLRQKVIRHLATQAARAGAVKGELLDSDNELVRDRASTFVLGLADIAPASTPSFNVSLELKAGYCIDLRDDPPPPMRIISTPE